MNDELILVTATISPHRDVPVLRITDTNERLNQYKDGLRFLLSCKYINKIVFCDNSHYIFDTSEFLSIARSAHKEIEFLSFAGSKSLVLEHGKGAGEIEIIRYALHNSRLMNSVDSFYKLTGRVKITNIDTIIKLSKHGRNYFTRHQHFGRARTVDTIFYKLTKAAFLKFGCIENEVDDKSGKWIEHVMSDNLQKFSIEFHFFPSYPLVDGLSGSTGNQYNEHGLRLLAKRILSRIGLIRLFL